MAKTKDLFLNMVANPDMTLEDLASVGLTSENTMLLDRALYASNEKVQDMFRDTEGNFDEQKFNTWYDLAEQSYNILANDEANLNLMNVTAYDADNIFVDPSKRRAKNEPLALKLPNPDRLNVGITRIGKIGPRTLSQDEIAQTLKVLLNPTAVANGGDPIYGSAPNDSWFEDFWDTRVMAAWDEDGTHIDPVTGKETKHSKGDLKLNENGTYYYESLDGRSVYGKRVLNKFNTLTTDGSSWNKYDFFDSDSIELKSIGGSVLKNLALVGSMFIPYVGWGVAAASVAHQMAGLTATFGKMLAGSDSPTLDAIEGWVKSTDRRNLKTEYAQQNTWCWENFIDLIGDTTALLREQRAIFKFAPGIIKGDFKALSEKAMKEYGEELAKKELANATSLSFKDLYKLAAKKGGGDPRPFWEPIMQGAQKTFSLKAEKAVRKYLDDYYKLGEPIAKAYMTAITVQDTFGEAIQAGATDAEATMLTLGYAAAEAALLSTDLGKWIMPELRTNRLRNKMIAKKLFELPQETRELSKQLTKLDGESKKAWAKRLFNVGKDIARAEYSTMPTTIGTIAAQGLGEGVEEVSEEALADFSKSCFNLVLQLQGDDVRMNAWNHNWDWSEAASRYGMSFAGGIIGGGINAAASDYKANREILNMDSKKAMLQLIYMARNNELDDFWKTVNKTTLAPTELSTQLNDDGIGYKPGTKEDNQDLAAKRALRKQVDLITSILDAENVQLDDEGLLASLLRADPTLKDLDPVKEYRMHALANSATAGRFLNEWNTITSDIVKTQIDIRKLTSKLSDNKELSETDEQELKKKKKDLKTLLQRKEAMLDGTRTREYVRDALFEMTHPVKDAFDTWATVIRYSEAMTGKKYSDISEEQKTKLKDLYEKVKSSNLYAELIHLLADIYEALATTSSQGIQASADFYEQVKQGSYQKVTELDKIMQARLDRLIQYTQDENSGINAIQNTLDKNYKESFKELYADDATFMQGFDTIQLNINDQIEAIINGRPEDELLDFEKQEIQDLIQQGDRLVDKYLFDYLTQPSLLLMDEFIQLGFIHPETKLAMKNMVETLKLKYQDQANFYQVDFEDGSGSLESYDNWMRFADIVNQLNNKLEQVDLLSNTPIVENLKLFLLSTDTDKTVIDLINYLHKRENTDKGDVSTITLDTLTKQQITDSRKLLELYRSAIAGARFDNVDIDNIVGFNTTLNELSGANEGVKLAEIDGQTADLVLEDINTLLKRLDFVEGLHKLNTGNKYNTLSKTALNKNYILFNKIKHFVSILDDEEDKWKDLNGLTSFQELHEALNQASTLSRYAGASGNYDLRTFAITPEEKDDVESQLIDIQVALHNFFKDRIANDLASVDKLAELFTYNRFKGLIRENNDFLNQDSQDIDDSAFIWWLCATAALDPTQFNVNYNAIVGQEKDGERPIAPIPTQELGVFALTAAITNGDMFTTFGKALRKSLLDFWESRTDTERNEIAQQAGFGVFNEKDKDYFKNSDFLPNFENIVFIEGIAGSGKSTGVLKTLSRVLANSNPEFVSKKFIFAHTDKNKATTLGNSTEFKNFEAHDHDSLLKYMSSDYNPPTIENGVAVYEMDTDVHLVYGILRAPWKVNKYNQDEVPSVIFIDEWSHYNQLEQDLIQRFCQEYGTTVIAMGDYDLLTPKAKIKFTNSSDTIEITPNRNMGVRVAKLGVSMRTDNDAKTGNIYRMLAWRLNSASEVQLHYFEDDSGIYGDKLYEANLLYDKATLDKIKLDVQKMISTLKDGEKIGYIYHSDTSELYKWLTENLDIKDHIIPYQEKDAHGREAQYYIVENDRTSNQNALDYFESVYTGITRSEQGSIVITNSSPVREIGRPDKFNNIGLKFTSVKDPELLADTYTDEGTRTFTQQRKRSLDKKYQGQEVNPFDIKSRTRQAVPITSNVPSQSTGGTSGLNTPQPSNQPTLPTGGLPSVQNQPAQGASLQGTQQAPQGLTTQGYQSNTLQGQTLSLGTTLNALNSTQSTLQSPQLPTQQTPPGGGLPPLPPEGATIQTPPALGPGALVQHPEPSLEEFGGTRTPEGFDPTELFAGADENWQGPLPKGLKLYMSDGSLEAIIVGEHGDYYSLYYPMLDRTEDELKDVTEELYFFSVPEYKPTFKAGTKIKYEHDNSIDTLALPFLYEFEDGTVDWCYEIQELSTQIVSDSEIREALAKGYVSIVNNEVLNELPPENDFENEGAKEWMEAANEVMSDSSEVMGTDSTTRKLRGTVNIVNGDLDFRPFGFTFNNQYFADKFDKNGAIVFKSEDALRIDNGYGLYKINPQAFGHKSDIENVIGEIRKWLEFGTNKEIQDCIQRLTGVLGLKVEWGFVSKVEQFYNGPAGRYVKPKATPEYMVHGEFDKYLMGKHIVAMVYKDGKPILELPIISLLSPHSIFIEMDKKGICSDITRRWTFGNKPLGVTFRDLKNIIAYIDSTYPNHPGYLNLKEYLKLYLFDSYGFLRITDPSGVNAWNLAQYCPNKGNFYVTERYSDNGVFAYEGDWREMKDLVRKDRFVSPILMNNDDRYYDGVHENGIPIFRKYTPYVFISDDPHIQTVEDAALLYLRQQVNPDIPKTVKAVPVVPPENSVTEYIRALQRVKLGSTTETLGNKYSAYRVWNYILDPSKNTLPFTIKGVTYPSKAAFVMSQLDESMRNDVLKYVKILNDIATNNPILPNESKLDYKVRLAALQNAVLDSRLNDIEGAQFVFERLRLVLLASCKFLPFGDSDVVQNDILDTIQSLCDEGKCTGILHRPGFNKDQAGVAIGGFAYTVKTDGDFNFPGLGSYRQYGKIDPPTYQMHSLFPHIKYWNSITSVNGNIRKFNNDHEYKYYLDTNLNLRQEKPRLNLTNIQNFYNELYRKLGMPEYNIDRILLESCATEAEARTMAINIISKMFTELNPGSFYLYDSRNNKYRYCKISDYLPEYEGYRFLNYQQSTDGTYLIEMLNTNSGSVEVIEIELTNDNSFQVKPKQKPKNNTVNNIAKIKETAKIEFESTLLAQNENLRLLFNNLLNMFDEVNNTVNIQEIERLLIDANLTPMRLRTIKNLLYLEEINELQISEQSLDTSNEQIQDVCVNPITINFI